MYNNYFSFHSVVFGTGFLRAKVCCLSPVQPNTSYPIDKAPTSNVGYPISEQQLDSYLTETIQK